jgi:hypothetical protein
VINQFFPFMQNLGRSPVGDVKLLDLTLVLQQQFSSHCVLVDFLYLDRCNFFFGRDMFSETPQLAWLATLLKLIKLS